MASTGLRCHAAFDVKDVNTFLANIKPMLEASRKEKGCNMIEAFEVAKGTTDKKKYALISHWASKEDLEAHHQSAHVKEYLAKSKDNRDGDPVGVIYKSLGI